MVYDQRHTHALYRLHFELISPAPQVLTLLTSIRCLHWSPRYSALAIGQEPQLSFFRIDPQQVAAHKRARNRQVNISGKHSLPEPIWLRQGHGQHHGSYRLARIKAKQERQHLSDPKLHQVCPDCAAMMCAPDANQMHRATPAPREAIDADNLALSTKHTSEHLVLVQTPLLQALAPDLEGPDFGHTDAVTSVVITDRGLVMSGGLDRALCVVTLTKPKDSFKKVEHAHAHGAISVAHDSVNNWFISGGIDGALKVWSADAKPMMAFSGVTDDLVRVVYVPLSHCYWHVDRLGHIQVRPPCIPDLSHVHVWSHVASWRLEPDPVLACPTDHKKTQKKKKKSGQCAVLDARLEQQRQSGCGPPACRRTTRARCR